MNTTPELDFGVEVFEKKPTLHSHLAAEITRAIARFPAREIVVDRSAGRRTMKAGLVWSLAMGLADELKRNHPERRIGLVLPPGLGGLIGNLAVVLADKVPVNLNYTAGRAALTASINKAGVKAVLSAQVVRERIDEKFPGFPWPDTFLDVPTLLGQLGKPGIIGRMAAISLLPGSLVVKQFGLPTEGGNREAALLFTSGSVGQPKGVALTHRNILGNCLQIDASGVLPTQETILANLPVFHSFGFTVTIWYVLLKGVRAVTLPTPLDIKANIQTIREEKPTILIGTPTFFRPYLARATKADLASVKCVIAGAEKTPEGFHDKWEKHFGGRYYEGYGLTETSPVVSVNLPDELSGSRVDAAPRQGGCRRGSVGRLFPGMAARIVDPESGVVQPIGAKGVLELRGPNIFGGYLDDPEATAESFNGDWFRTGDFARLDDEGFIYIEGRLSRFSKIGGEMVPHGTVEEAVSQAYGLTEREAPAVMVTAREDEAKGEALVLLTTETISPDELRAKLSAEGFANLWIPREIHRVDSIPTLASGKLDLKRCRDLAKKS